MDTVPDENLQKITRQNLIKEVIREPVRPDTDMAQINSAEDNKCKVRTKPWNLNTKNLKDLLVRTYPSFAQIIISPVSTGLRHTINTNVVSDT